MDNQTKASALGLGAVMFTQFASLAARQIKSGRSGFSHLERTIELPLNKINFDFFMQVFGRRIDTLGFQAADNDGNYLQGGVDPGLGSASHAKTKKLLTLRVRDTSPDQVLATLTLRYVGLIIVDTGESAYRDALLDFLSGKADEMATVPNESLMAMNSLIGGGIACIVAILLVVLDKLDLWPAIPTIAVTEFAVGLLALYSIGQKPDEITGRGKAIAGIVLSLVAIGLGIYFIIANHSSPPG